MRERHRPSLTRRLWLAAVVLVLLSLAGAGVVIDRTLERFTTSQLDQRLDAQLIALTSALTVGTDGTVTLARDLDVPPYDRALSGWYWQVADDTVLLRSRSLGDAALGDDPIQGPRGEPLHVRRRTIRLAGDTQPLAVQVTAPRDVLVAPVRETRRILWVTLSVLGAALLSAVTAQVFLGLRPLRLLARGLSDVRAGRARRITDRQPAEISELVEELNALLAQNADQTEKARAHIANLAHGIKTPLATLAAELRPDHPIDRDVMRQIVTSIDRRVTHHLRRARSASLLGARHVRAPLEPAIADLILALSKIYADRNLRFEASIADEHDVACDPDDLNEMCGNLLDNACKWAASSVSVRSVRDKRSIKIVITDDGPGLAPDQIDLALERGKRLDEIVPGSGFGLPITRELAELYGGEITFVQMHPGLGVTLTLPAAA